MVRETMRILEPLAHVVPEIRSLVEEGKWDILKDLLVDVSPLDLSESWYQFSPDEKTWLFKLLPTNSALVLFESLDPEDQTLLLGSLEDTSVTSLLEGIPSKEVAELFHTLPKRAVRKMTRLVKKEDAIRRIELLMKFEPGTAGSLLHPEFIRLEPRMTARSAIDLIQSLSRKTKRNHFLRSLYVTSETGELLGRLTPETLVASPPDSLLADLMENVNLIKVYADTDQEEVAVLFQKYDLLSAPVVERGTDKLLGSVVVDDILDVMKQEATEDIAKMVGSRVEEFRSRSSLRIAWYRSPWLLVALLGQFLVFGVIRHFEYVLNEVIALASFLPLIAAMGGNAGSQSAIIFVRNMAIGQVRGKNKYLALLKEMRVGLLMGIGYGLLVGGTAYFVYHEAYGVSFAFVVGCSVALALAIATTVGVIGPIVLNRIGIDPATAVGPMITTTTDFISITLYFLLASAILLGGP